MNEDTDTHTGGAGVALVTGAGSGVGRAVAVELAVAGWTVALAGRPFRIACGRLDIGDAATDTTARMRTGALQADGSTAVEPVMDIAAVARTVRATAALPLDANVQFATVTATATPFAGRG